MPNYELTVLQETINNLDSYLNFVRDLRKLGFEHVEKDKLIQISEADKKSHGPLKDSIRHAEKYMADTERYKRAKDDKLPEIRLGVTPVKLGFNFTLNSFPDSPIYQRFNVFPFAERENIIAAIKDYLEHNSKK